MSASHPKADMCSATFLFLSWSLSSMDHRDSRYSGPDRGKAPSSSCRCYPRGRLGQPVHAPCVAFLWIWAMAYQPERGWGFSHGTQSHNANELEDLRRRVIELEKGITLRSRSAPRLKSPSTRSTGTISHCCERSLLRMRSWENYVFLEGH